MIHLEGREASKAVKSCDTCKHDEAFGCPSFIHDRCENYSEWEQADGDLTTALCSLPKIQSSDGQDYVQLADVLETVRRYVPSVSQPQDGDRAISLNAVIEAIDVWDSYAKTIKRIKELSSVTPKPQWIPVSERLPEERQDVLACFYNGEGNYKMMVSRRTDYNYWSGVGRTADMVAWMPLPTPYEPQERSDKE